VCARHDSQCPHCRDRCPAQRNRFWKLFLVVGYLVGVAGFKFARLAGIAQFTYMILFSYSFFFDGLTGITITIGAILTLALLMLFSAKTDWTAVFTSAKDKGGASVAGVSNGFP